VAKSAKKGRSASYGRGVLTIKTCSAKWKVGFVSAQKPFLVITNDKFTREITVPLTVHRPFGIVIGRSAKQKIHNVGAKWALGNRGSDYHHRKNEFISREISIKLEGKKQNTKIFRIAFPTK
jgi:hypothetical protein